MLEKHETIDNIVILKSDIWAALQHGPVNWHFIHRQLQQHKDGSDADFYHDSVLILLQS